jgi:hypothetical protein
LARIQVSVLALADAAGQSAEHKMTEHKVLEPIRR